MRLKFDLHVHTVNSRDAFTDLDELSSFCRVRGLNGVAITDHNHACPEVPGGTIGIPGIEVSSKDGHVVGLGLTSQVRKGLSADETIREIHRQGGVAVIPHPYERLRPSVNPDLLTVRPDAIEVFNASTILRSLTRKRAIGFATETGLPPIAGSDSHIPQTIGTAYTLVDSYSTEPASLLEAIKNGHVQPMGESIWLSQRLRKLLLQARRSR